MAHIALRDVDVLATCKANGYPDSQPQTARDALAWAVAQGAEFRLDDGRTVPASEVEIVAAPEVRRTFSIPPTVAPHTTWTTASPRPVLDDGRPGTTDVRVRSVHEALWDARAKRGERLPFSSFAQGLAAREYLRMLVYQRRGRIAEASACEREFARLCTDILGYTYTSGGATTGAAFVPDVFLPELIRNVEEFGAYSRILAPIRTTNATLILPRDHGLVSIAFPDEGATLTPQVTSPDNVVLRSRKGMAIVRASNELLADAGIDAAAFIFTAMAESIARAIDNSLLRDGARADGVATPFVGFTAKYGTTAPATATANAVTGGDTALLHTLAHLSQLIGSVNRFSGQAKFVCSAAMWAYVFLRVGQTAGGVVPAILAAPGQESFAGYPVVVVSNEIMNSTADVGSGTYAPGFTAGDAPDILFGYFDRAAKLMIQQDIELDFSDQVRFEHDQGVFRVRARWDVNVHDVGSATSRGPVACLWQT